MQDWMAVISSKIESMLKSDLEERGLSPSEMKRVFQKERRVSLTEMNGYLLKRAVKSGRNWKRRYFRLQNSTLNYFTDEYAAGKKHPKGTVKLTTGTTIMTGPEAKAEEEEMQRQAEQRQREAQARGEELVLPLIFERALWETGTNIDKVIVITTPRCKLFIKGETLGEMQAWLGALNGSLRQMMIKDGGTLMAVYQCYVV